jgi:hypothetical protein
MPEITGQELRAFRETQGLDSYMDTEIIREIRYRAKDGKILKRLHI